MYRTAVIVLASVGLLGCTASPPGIEPLDTDRLDLDAYSDVKAELDFDAGQVELPADSIDHLGPEFEKAWDIARHTVIDGCLAAAGSPPYEWSTRPNDMDNRMWGSWSIRFASPYGYSDSSVVDSPITPELTESEKSCFSEADELIRPALSDIDTYDIDDQIRSASYAAVRASPAGRSALEDARNCMRSEGLTLDAASGHPVSEDTAANSESNIRIAVIEATCNVQTGAVQTLFDLTARYQAALMDANEAAVVALQEKNADRIAALHKIAADYAP